MSPSLARLIVVESSAVAGAGRCRGAGVKKCLDRSYTTPNRSRGVRVTQNVTAAESPGTKRRKGIGWGLLSAFDPLGLLHTRGLESSDGAGREDQRAEQNGWRR